jgi:hypothetical protein
VLLFPTVELLSSVFRAAASCVSRDTVRLSVETTLYKHPTKCTRADVNTCSRCADVNSICAVRLGNNRLGIPSSQTQIVDFAVGLGIGEHVSLCTQCSPNVSNHVQHTECDTRLTIYARCQLSTGAHTSTKMAWPYPRCGLIHNMARPYPLSKPQNIIAGTDLAWPYPRECTASPCSGKVPEVCIWRTTDLGAKSRTLCSQRLHSFTALSLCTEVFHSVSCSPHAVATPGRLPFWTDL